MKWLIIKVLLTFRIRQAWNYWRQHLYDRIVALWLNKKNLSSVPNVKVCKNKNVNCSFAKTHPNENRLVCWHFQRICVQNLPDMSRLLIRVKRHLYIPISFNVTLTAILNFHCLVIGWPSFQPIWWIKDNFSFSFSFTSYTFMFLKLNRSLHEDDWQKSVTKTSDWHKFPWALKKYPENERIIKCIELHFIGRLACRVGGLAWHFLYHYSYLGSYT